MATAAMAMAPGALEGAAGGIETAFLKIAKRILRRSSLSRGMFVPGASRRKTVPTSLTTSRLPNSSPTTWMKPSRAPEVREILCWSSAYAIRICSDVKVLGR